jgi:hypothetical protein
MACVSGDLWCPAPAGVHVPGPGEGYIIMHNRAKQRRSDKLEYAAQLGLYLFKVNNQLKKYQGRVWFTGTDMFDMFTGTLTCLKNQPMGRNTIAKMPHGIATLLSLANPSLYTFRSSRRTSATSAADGGSSTAPDG